MRQHNDRLGDGNNSIHLIYEYYIVPALDITFGLTLSLQALGLRAEVDPLLHAKSRGHV